MKTDLLVWHAGLDVVPSLQRQLGAMLSEDEQARARRFVFDRDRRRFEVARGVLRSILASLLSVSPQRIRFRYTDRGKPFLSEEFDTERLCFNLAHSQRHGMFAITRAAEVGVDIEAIRPFRRVEAIAARFLSARECAEILAVPPALREPAFFRCWTKKEAYIKAVGAGLSYPLDRFDVAVATEEPVQLLHIDGDSQQSADWRIHDVSDLPAYASAVALKAPSACLQFLEWEPRMSGGSHAL